MKDPVFLSSPVVYPKVPSQPSIVATLDDHLIPLLSQDNFTFKAQLTSHYIHPTDYTFRFRIYDKNQDFSHQSLQKSCLHTNIGLNMDSKSFLFNSTITSNNLSLKN